MDQMIEHIKKDLKRYHFFLYENVTKQDYKFIESDLQGIVAQINTFYDECEKEEQRDQLNELKAIAESYRERAKALQELYQKQNTEQEIEK